MTEPRKHYLVEFASRYAGARIKTLNAGSALWRAESLVHDTAALLELKDSAEAKGVRFGQRGGTYEIISYFAVGFVTCLEWHARSRLVDTMLFKPSCIAPSDLKNIATVALSQMVAEGATIPHLLAAATNVSCIQDYLSIFRRVLQELRVHEDIEKALRATKTGIYVSSLDGDTSLYGVLAHLFEYRNRLVHEIDLATIGHFSIRDMWELPQAQQYGKAVVDCIKLVESNITASAPKDFPNRLDAEGTPEDEYGKLMGAISAMEAELTPQIELLRTVDRSSSRWAEALSAIRTARQLELDFLENASFLRPGRHFDIRREVQIEYLRSRLAFLSLLKSELD
jgi:hypothetical protein